MNCEECKLPIKNLTYYRSRFKFFCVCNSDYPAKYHFERILIDQKVIYPWSKEHKCYNYSDSNSIRCCLRQYIKKHGGQFYVRRHLAGIEVTRLS